MSLDTPRTDIRTASRPGGLPAHEARQRLAHERDTRLTQLRALAEAGHTAEEQLMSAQRDTIQRVLKEIDAALSRVQDGTYGTCQGCSKPIPVERLEILPYTGWCVPCQRDAV
ncbi:MULTISPECIES: TraR/DksA family transcriptional regulator [Streptomyces]|uniref:RNA polymerase-binding transcription factor DksA n=1 Tax=Streptomyces stelliscabiei TaxID=146820 RepID=A0A8I0TVZ5_9ACTN|nr:MULTISPECIES: TraR/DksA C4-type zinc finger protein [Streptomyces]KND42904.1 molecular chaperone DnaK [Streptomyces stelliscabiei]MBE1602437.1 RNA polymerase-binding transcription factor DksA [Streptomyces stelliscabiei]MDX2516662.1 TraR/DksA C4-type zinc finger protein [Streptomyces stelliscabiei]MDX2550407.1 TraR/DksA C4-type zinc finger protein [Streptomyces stelliscabiei]MDX2610105.1 TraR/DksA C4-type zinc finger protein [Streptomyces stelliscabiei]